MQSLNNKNGGKMKRLLCGGLLLLLLVSCIDKEQKVAYLTFSIERSPLVEQITKSSLKLLDTNNFILSVKSASGKVIYEGSYGKKPDVMSVPEGIYQVDINSTQFDQPMFDKPLLGDYRTISVGEGDNVAVAFMCKRQNGGIKMNFSDNYKRVYGSKALYLESDQGDLEYGYEERRTAYFKPGYVSFVNREGKSSEVLFTKEIAAGEILTINIDTSDDGSGINSNFSIAIDTSAVRNVIPIFIGDGGGIEDGSCKERALSVDAVRHNIGQKVWVKGYIVGGDLTQNEISYKAPFNSSTHFAIASKPSVWMRDFCVAVELPSKVRDALNLVDNPTLLGRMVWVYGTIVETYFNLNGVKSVSDYSL